MEENKEVEQEISFEEKYIRLYADFENYKKRAVKEKNETVVNTKYTMINGILDLDNDLTIAASHIKDDNTKDIITLMLSKIENFLNSNGVKTVQTEKYDSDLHEVISVLNPNGTNILNVVSKGYMINDKVIRHPKVVLG